MAVFLLYQFASSTGTPTPQQPIISLAVLPFANLSSDPEQEFFSDGMTDEITSALAKVRDLRVVGRSSAFQFKGQNRDLRAVGQSLGATHLIEGSVRRAGNQLRITAQLIQAENGLNIWAETYDRELTDVFATQEDIAQAIAVALRVPLGLPPGGRLVSNRISDIATYEDYLRARALPGRVLARLCWRRCWRDPAMRLRGRCKVQLEAELFSPRHHSGLAEEARRLVRVPEDGDGGMSN
jgi:TolB-like protein